MRSSNCGLLRKSSRFQSQFFSFGFSVKCKMCIYCQIVRTFFVWILSEMVDLMGRKREKKIVLIRKKISNISIFFAFHHKKVETKNNIHKCQSIKKYMFITRIEVIPSHYYCQVCLFFLYSTALT